MDLPHKQPPFLQDKEGHLKLTRYEWYLYLQIPSRLNGKLTLPGVAKYQALEADLVSTERWKNDRELLVAQTLLPKLAADPGLLIQDMEQALDSRLRAVTHDSGCRCVAYGRSRHWLHRVLQACPRCAIKEPRV